MTTETGKGYKRGQLVWTDGCSIEAVTLVRRDADLARGWWHIRFADGGRLVSHESRLFATEAEAHECDFSRSCAALYGSGGAA